MSRAVVMIALSVGLMLEGTLPGQAPVVSSEFLESLRRVQAAAATRSI